MILLDTNVISEAMLDEPEPRVIAWLDSLDPMQVGTTILNIYELEVGFASLPVSRRRSAIINRLDVLRNTLFGGRIEMLDMPAAVAAGRLAAWRAGLGKPKGVVDTLIAGIAIATGAVIATRNVKDFEDAGVLLINPWTI